MSDANRVGLAYVKETTYGTTPSGPPTLKNFRWVSESLKQNTQTVSSQEVRSDRQVSDLIRTGLSVAGQITGELSYNAYDDLFEWGLCSDATWTSALDVVHNSATDNIVVAASGSNFTLTLTTTNWVTLGFSTTADVGKFVKLGSTANPWTLAANNGYAKIVSVGGSGNKVLTVSGLAMTAATQSSGSVAIRRCAQLVNGTTLASMAIEKSFTDLSNEFVMENGCMVDGMSLDIGLSKVLGVNFDILGKIESSATATAGTGTNTAAPTKNVMNSIDNITGVVLGGSAFSITSFKPTVKNNLRQRLQVGTLGPISIGAGTLDVTFDMEAYFTSKTQMDLYRNFTATTFFVKFVDSAGNAYILDLPQIKFSDGEQVGGGINTDVIAKFKGTAYMNATESKTIRLVRSDAN